MNYIEPLKNINYIEPLKNVASYLSWTKEAQPTLLCNKEIIKIASILNSTHIDNALIDLPKLVVVGTQSSGKSSLLNSLIGIDILPIGKSMTTRTPLHLDLIATTTENRIEFGSYNNLQWFVEKKIIITYPSITQEQRIQVINEIENQTNMKAGTELNICSNPIYVKIYATGIQNLSLIDLPGLTSIAITDKGQPKDIKDQIINLVSSYIKQKNSLIIAVIAARHDIEADMAMELIKNADPQGNRTIGVLTKIDLMNDDSDITNYLENNVSNDLKLKYGYFGIRNKPMGLMSGGGSGIGSIIEAERVYFANHPVYRNERYKSRLGIPILTTCLSNILISNIKQCLPGVLNSITNKLTELQIVIQSLGESVPNNKEAKINILNNLISLYIKNYVQAIEQRGSLYATGRLIKERFDEYRNEIDKYNPFIEMDDNILLVMLKSYDGLHMNFPYLPIEVLESTLVDKKLRPIYKLYDPSQKCLQSILDLLNDLSKKILEDKPLSKYPNLIKQINLIIINDILLPKYQQADIKIKELIEQEESLIWTDDKHFQQIMMNEFSKIVLPNGNFNIDKFKLIMYEYYKTVIRNVRENIPKATVYNLIKNNNLDIANILYDKIIGSGNVDIATILDEFPEIEEQRRNSNNMNKELLEIKKLIENAL
jgi:vacuolar protein sorting-associated protein 1